MEINSQKKDLSELIKILNAELGIYDEYIKAETEKSAVVVTNDTDKLDKILNDEQVLSMRLSNIEKKRMEMSAALGFAGKTLAEIAELSYGAEKESLIGIYNEFGIKIDSIRRINDYNMRIVKSRLAAVTEINNYLGNPGGGVRKAHESKIYGKGAKIEDLDDGITRNKKKI